jgi:hypothetical protein
MTRAFSIKRRKQDTPRPGGQSSQAALLSALGIFSHHTSPHGGSKQTYIHLADPASRLQAAAAQEWSLATGRPLPPHLRARAPLQPAAPLDVRARAGNYTGMRLRGPGGIVTSKQLAALPAAALLDDSRLTPRQRRRALHKAGAHGERPAGWLPAARVAEASRVSRARAQRALRHYWRHAPLTAAGHARLASGQPILAAPAVPAYRPGLRPR